MPVVPKDRIILGCMTFGPGSRIPDLQDFKDCLMYFQSQGYNELDTARTYLGGLQEVQLQKVGWKEMGFKLATKLYPNQPGTHKPEVLRAKFQESLDALGVSKVDIFYLHAPDRSLPFEETLEEVNKLHKEGKFDMLGLSNYTSFEVAEICCICRERGWVRPRIFQTMYNVLMRDVEKELIPACRKWGLAIVNYNPLAGGLMSGKYKTKDIPPEGRFSDQEGGQGPNYRKRYFRDVYFEALRLLEPISVKYSIPLTSMALRWMVHHSQLSIKEQLPWGDKDGIIIGVSSKKQLEDNLSSLEQGPLPDEVVQALDEAWKITKVDSPNYWHLELKYAYDTWI